jgi:hypothetical protein
MLSPCYKVGVLRKRLLWVTQCLLFCVAGIFVAGRLSSLLNPLVWWGLHQSRNTFLQRPSFVATYYLPLIGIYGFCLGLIPIHRLKELFASSLGKIEFRSTPGPELVFSRPLLWAWTPVGLVLGIRFLSRSVNFPHLAKNARYGAPEFVAGKIPEIFCSHADSLPSESHPFAWIPE